MSVRVRFAPSPTGHLHIGGARTALYNWLFARQNDGIFLLRIEDTDQERSGEEMVGGILEGLTWLGLNWDEGPFFQSRNLESHRGLSERLTETGHAYRDFSTSDAEPGSYRCFRDLDPGEAEKRRKSGEPFAVRFKVPENQKIEFEDLVFGPIMVEANNLEDFVILRSDGYPTYHLSVVSDDLGMGITHVIRGADHLSNTAKHILLYQALGESIPTYVHLPLILGPDKKRLSKRHGATSVTEYRDHDLLPEAVCNYIALLGWSPGDDSELLSLDQLIEKFDVSRIGKANAVFDYAKLEWVNKRYISSCPAEALEPLVRRQIEKADLWRPDWGGERRQWFLAVIDLLKTRVQDLPDFPIYGRAFFTDDFVYDDDALAKYLKPDHRSLLEKSLKELRTLYEQMKAFNLETTEEALRGIAAQNDIKAGQLIGAVRLACTGKAQAPGIFDVLVALGKDTVIARLDRLIRYIG